MTHDEIIERIANGSIKGIDLSGYINYFDEGHETSASALLVFDNPIGDITCLELFDLFSALRGKNIDLNITVLPSQTT